MTALQFGQFRIDPARGVLCKGDRPVEVQPLVYQLLLHGALHAGELLARDELMAMLWPDTTVTEHSLTQLTHRIRSLLGASRGWWVTVPRKGYRFDAPVERLGQVELAGAYDFHGRVDELRTLAELLDAHSWVTLWGPGGAGKTRLALEFVSRRAERWASCTHVDLAATTDVYGLCRRMARALEVELSTDEADAAIAQLARALARRDRCLVLVDNLEQLDNDAREALSSWAAAAPELRWLGTSRDKVGVQGEHLFELPPLSRDASEDLFRQRATQAGGEIAEAHAEDIGAIVEALEGSPLALELAAARLPLLAPSEIRRRLDQQLALLGGRRLGLARHRSMRAVVAWSWELLDPSHQYTLACCALFTAGFTVPMAEAVVDPDAPGGEVLDRLQLLRDHSLLQRSAVQTRPVAGRLRMAEVVRTFAMEHLDTLDPSREAVCRFVDLMRARAHESEELAVCWDRPLVDRTLDDLANTLEALEYADPEPRRDLAEATVIVLGTMELASLARRVLEQHLGPIEPARASPRMLLALLAAAGTSDIAGLYAAAEQRAVEQVAQGEATVAADLWLHLARHYAESLDQESALRAAARALELAQAIGDAGRAASACAAMATAHLRSGHLEEAANQAERGLEYLGPIVHPRVRVFLMDLRSYMLGQQGRYDEAERGYREVLALEDAHRLLARRALTMVNMASMLQESGNFEEALTLQTQALEHLQDLGIIRNQAILAVNRALTNIHLGRLHEAEADLRFASARDPGPLNQVTVAMNGAALEAVRGRWQQVLVRTGRGLELLAQQPLGPRRSALLLWRTLAFAAVGERDQAARERAGAHALDHDIPPFLEQAWHRVDAFLADREPEVLARPHPLVVLVDRVVELARRP